MGLLASRRPLPPGGNDPCCCHPAPATQQVEARGTGRASRSLPQERQLTRPRRLAPVPSRAWTVAGHAEACQRRWRAASRGCRRTAPKPRSIPRPHSLRGPSSGSLLSWAAAAGRWWGQARARFCWCSVLDWNERERTRQREMSQQPHALSREGERAQLPAGFPPPPLGPARQAGRQGGGKVARAGIGKPLWPARGAFRGPGLRLL